MRYPLTLIVLFSLSFSSLPAQQFFTGTKSTTAKSYYQEGVASMKNGTWGNAFDQLNRALNIDSSYIDAYIAQGVVCRKLYKQSLALKNFNKAINLYPRSLLAHEQLALLYQEMGYLKDAVTVYKQLLSHYPAYAEGFSGLAKTYFTIGEKKAGSSSTEAIQAYMACVRASEQAMRLYLRTENNRNAADVRLLAGRAYMEVGDYQSALKYIKASKRQLENKPYYYYYLGLCYFRKGDKEKAKGNFDVARAMGYQIPQYMENRLQNWR